MEQIQRVRWAAATTKRTMVLKVFASYRLRKQRQVEITSFSRSQVRPREATVRQKVQRVFWMLQRMGKGCSRRSRAAMTTKAQARKVGVFFWQIWIRWLHMQRLSVDKACYLLERYSPKLRKVSLTHTQSKGCPHEEFLKPLSLQGDFRLPFVDKVQKRRFFCLHILLFICVLYAERDRHGTRILIIAMIGRAADKKQVRYAVGALGLGVLFYGLFKLYRYISTQQLRASGINSSFDNDADISRQTESFISQSNQHSPYEFLIEDGLRDKIQKGMVKIAHNIKQISYKIILSLMKGNSYQGIVNMSFYLESLPVQSTHFVLNFRGSGLKYLMVNGTTLQPKQIQYLQHEILIPRYLMREKNKNHIEVIFQNYYSFLNEGLSTYFVVDDNQKYSLRQQVVYSVNGLIEVQKLVPCLNVLNQCKVHLEVIHSDTFQVFSNTAKSLERLCSAVQYQKYSFLFDLTSSTLNKSFKMTESTLSNYSGIENTLSASYSSVNYYNRKKANTHFYKQHLPSIHNLFIFSSPMVQLQPNAPNHPLESQILLRYFCKHTESHKLIKNINKIHGYILDVFRRLYSEKIKEHINKIDILVVGDRQVEGHFAPGVIMLSQDALKQSALGIRCFYLIVRAILGLLRLEKGKKGVVLEDVLELNFGVYEKFQEFRNYLYIKNCKFSRIRTLITHEKNVKNVEKWQGHILKYFNKELRFIISEDISSGISYELNNLMLSCKAEEPDQFWQNFINNHNFFSPLIIEPLIKLGLRRVPLPQNRRLREQLKVSFSNSKYFLSFYSNQEISDNLPKFIEVEAYGLEQRLTQVKVKQKFKDFITEKYEMYLPIKSNHTEADTMYRQLKHFNEQKNFHHYSVLKSEVSRIRYFSQNMLEEERVSVNCSIMGWKLLTRIKLYPKDEEHYNLLKFLQSK